LEKTQSIKAYNVQRFLQHISTFPLRNIILQYWWTIVIPLQHTGYFILASNETYF